MNATDARGWLRDRADSYSRDARRFREMDDGAVWAAMYQAIATELRRCADEVGTVVPTGDVSKVVGR